MEPGLLQLLHHHAAIDITVERPLAAGIVLQRLQGSTGPDPASRPSLVELKGAGCGIPGDQLKEDPVVVKRRRGADEKEEF